MTNYKQRGFSLIELLVVVAIVGLLVAAGIVGYTTYIDSTKRAVVNAQGKQVFDALTAVSVARTTNSSSLIPECGLSADSESTLDSYNMTNTMLACAQSVVKDLQNVYSSFPGGTIPNSSLNSNPIVICTDACPNSPLNIQADDQGNLIDKTDYNKTIDCGSWQNGEIPIPPKGFTFLTPNLIGTDFTGTTINDFVPGSNSYLGGINKQFTVAVYVCESNDSNIPFKQAFKGLVTFTP